MSRYWLLLSLTALAACGPAGESAPVSAPAPAAVPRVAAVATASRTPVPVNLQGVIGADADSLQRWFGAPRLDIREGDARKLQFSGEACVLDIYLYPPKPGAPPTAAYLDARRASDGLDVDRASCVSALRK